MKTILSLAVTFLANGIGNVWANQEPTALINENLKFSPDQKSNLNLWTQEAENFNDEAQHYGLQSLNKVDDDNLYSLILFTPSDCKPLIFTQYRVSGREFAENITNVTLEIQNGKCGGSNASIGPYKNLVWKEIPAQEYDGGSLDSPPLEYYLVTLLAKYLPRTTKFLQCVNPLYYKKMDAYKNSLKICEGVQFGEILFLVCFGVAAILSVGICVLKCAKNRNSNSKMKRTWSN